MSTRSDIKDGRSFNIMTRGIIYTEELGWIDMGHAQGSDIISLKNQFLAGESSGQNFYTVMYRQDMAIFRFGARFGTGKFARWKIKRGRTLDDINRIMLAMMMSTAFRFERLQSFRAFSWYTDSGFSGEDLVSDLFGFYRAIMPGNYAFRVKPVSYEAALRRWDYYGPIGAHKNRGFRPIIFPDPLDPCSQHYPYMRNLPSFMTWLTPWSDFESGVVTILTKDGITLEFWRTH